MRIIAGEWRRRQLRAPAGEGTRPTADRTRETLFGMLTSRVGSFEGLRVADLFAGSGALGMEALSRGAEHCLFVEQDAAAVKILLHNISTLGAQRRTDVQSGSVLRMGPARAPVDILLLDPPYGTGAGAVALERLTRLGWISPATWIALETARSEPAEARGFIVDAERQVGSARITLLRLPEQSEQGEDDITTETETAPESDDPA
ncbi:16S rRNA (guanine(966)-N(2))-methyltransferase RsmD [Altererythrobacter xixiisoli]|uniref:16S rRNA (Guanine(966)-N(2))-methyltransferase RsmD n=1 Tax=Croceibacterium xixiisoli TaxID=1476466 RepID=A0A6I4TSS9_9SPHN|nr:16S rRNA (guanine(966)-N(2))-methyltransferase RsmD [Croceibacterium xixiisoli]MXO99006.1 16S rRNA (guanine(966)-N(2))-methyltransferase RsmD [Croceibacterium xixiisoli]